MNDRYRSNPFELGRKAGLKDAARWLADKEGYGDDTPCPTRFRAYAAEGLWYDGWQQGQTDYGTSSE